MSAGSRNTQGGQHGTQASVGTALGEAMVAGVRLAFGAPRAAGGVLSVQGQVKALPVLDAVIVSGPFYGTCNGPTGRCLLAIGHDGDHVRPEIVPVGKVQTRCSWCGRLICAGPLRDGLESHGIHDKCRKEIR